AARWSRFLDGIRLHVRRLRREHRIGGVEEFGEVDGFVLDDLCRRHRTRQTSPQSQPVVEAIAIAVGRDAIAVQVHWYVQSRPRQWRKLRPPYNNHRCNTRAENKAIAIHTPTPSQGPTHCRRIM